MAIPVEMPKMSDTMEEGVVVSWTVDEGQAVAAGDVIAQVETDKATMDLEVYDDGVLLKRVIEEGEAVPIGGLIAVLGTKGEDISGLLAKYSGVGNGAVTAAVDETASDTPEETAPESGPSADSGLSSDDPGRVRSSPLARKLARDHGINLATIAGTGPEGRIVKRDVESRIDGSSTPDVVRTPEAPAVRAIPPLGAPPPAATAPAVPSPPLAPPASGSTPHSATATLRPDGGHETIRISQMRKAISRRLSESKFSSPHFYLTVDLDMAEAIRARQRINELTEAQGLSRVSFNDLITKACALALREHRWVNASYLEDENEVRLHNDIHVAVAVAIDDGLITPVIRHADRKGLGQIAAETRALSERARAKELQPEEYSGSTFTTSNLGMFGIQEFTAIINPPNACILAIGAIRDEAVVENGTVVPGKRMKLTLSCDHRVVDGATGAQFLSSVGTFLQDPLSMLL